MDTTITQCIDTIVYCMTCQGDFFVSCPDAPITEAQSDFIKVLIHERVLDEAKINKILDGLTHKDRMWATWTLHNLRYHTLKKENTKS